MKNVLVIDVGGSNVKVGMTDKALLKIPSGKSMTAARMATAVLQAIRGWKYDAVSIGFPGTVKNGKPSHEPHNLSGGWMRFNYRRAFGKPVKIVNDAAMQALGAYTGGRMLFLGLGTGLGSALIAEGVLMPLELAHLPYRRGKTYEDYVGLRGLKRLGLRKWTRHVAKVVALLAAALEADSVVLGGGQTKKLKRLPPGTRLGTNDHAMLGGLKLWDPHATFPRKRATRPRTSTREHDSVTSLNSGRTHPALRTTRRAGNASDTPPRKVRASDPAFSGMRRP
jgi:predicted NBD/HSP70 family sugar kinase